MRTTLGSADEASFEERVADTKLVIEELVRYVYFMTLVEEQQCKVNQDTSLKKILFGPHEDLVKLLNQKQVSVFTVAMCLHCLVTNLYIYGKKNPEKMEPEVNMYSTATFDGARALEEHVLWLLTIGQNCEEEDYTQSGSSWVFNGKEPKNIIEIPGIGASQLDPRNQEALAYSHSIVKDLKRGEQAEHNHSLTKGGSYGNKAKYFLKSPLFLSGWPSASSDHDTQELNEDGLED